MIFAPSGDGHWPLQHFLFANSHPSIRKARGRLVHSFSGMSQQPDLSLNKIQRSWLMMQPLSKQKRVIKITLMGAPSVSWNAIASAFWQKSNARSRGKWHQISACTLICRVQHSYLFCMGKAIRQKGAAYTLSAVYIQTKPCFFGSHFINIARSCGVPKALGFAQL